MNFEAEAEHVDYLTLKQQHESCINMQNWIIFARAMGSVNSRGRGQCNSAVITTEVKILKYNVLLKVAYVLDIGLIIQLKWNCFQLS